MVLRLRLNSLRSVAFLNWSCWLLKLVPVLSSWWLRSSLRRLSLLNRFPPLTFLLLLIEPLFFLSSFLVILFCVAKIFFWLQLRIEVVFWLPFFLILRLLSRCSPDLSRLLKSSWLSHTWIRHGGLRVKIRLVLRRSQNIT